MQVILDGWLDKLREQHQPMTRAGVTMCAADEQEWPCQIGRLLARLDEQVAAYPGMLDRQALRRSPYDLFMDNGQVTPTGRVLALFLNERISQDIEWGEQNHPDGTGRPGDALRAVEARAACQDAAAQGIVTWRHILDEEIAEAYAESDPLKLHDELIDVGATVAVWIEAIDRRLLAAAQQAHDDAVQKAAAEAAGQPELGAAGRDQGHEAGGESGG